MTTTEPGKSRFYKSKFTHTHTSIFVSNQIYVKLFCLYLYPAVYPKKFIIQQHIFPTSLSALVVCTVQFKKKPQ